MRVVRKIALFVITLGLPWTLILPAEALTLTQLRTEARSLSLDSGASRQRYSDSVLNQWINEAQRVAVMDAKPIIRSGQFELAVGSTYYAMPSDFLQPYRVTLDYDVLDEGTPEAFDKQDRWQETGSEPTNYFIDFATRTKMGVYPWPESTSSTGTVRYEYFAQATDMSAASDVPFNSLTEMTPYHYGLAFYAAARMAALDGRADLAVLYMSEFRAMVERLNREGKARPSYRPGAIGSRGGPVR